MNLQLITKGILIVAIALIWPPLMAADSEPEILIKTTADDVLKIIKNRQAEFKEDPAKLFALVDEKVLPHFDFVRMTELALGRYKRKVNDQEKPLLVQEFRHLLVRTYGKALLEYNDQVIQYLPSRGSVEKGDVTVRTEIEQKGGFPIPLNYSLYKKDEGWKVYDITVDNISLVTNYRSSFAKKIKDSGVGGLIESLRSRNREES